MGTRDFGGMIEVCTSNLMTRVRNFTEDQLQAVLQDESRLDSMVDGLSQISALPNDKELRLVEAKSLAECNLSYERKLNDALKKLGSTHKNLVETKKEVQELKVKLEEITESRSLDSVCTMLKTLAQDAEEESEKISEEFRNGTIDVEEFVKQYCAKRAVAHTRKIKSGKLTELLSQQQYQPMSRISQANASNLGGHSGSSPYPMLNQPQDYGGSNDANYRQSYYNR